MFSNDQIIPPTGLVFPAAEPDTILKADARVIGLWTPEQAVAEGGATLLDVTSGDVVRLRNRLGGANGHQFFGLGPAGTRFTLAQRWNGWNAFVCAVAALRYRWEFPSGTVFNPNLASPFTMYFAAEIDPARTEAMVLGGRQTDSTNRCLFQRPAFSNYPLCLQFAYGSTTIELPQPKRPFVATVGYDGANIHMRVNRTRAEPAAPVGPSGINQSTGVPAAFALGALNTNGSSTLRGWLAGFGYIEGGCALTDPSLALVDEAILEDFRFNLDFAT